MRSFFLVCSAALVISYAAFGLELPVGTALLSYNLGDTSVSIAVFAAGGLQTVSVVPIPRQELAEKVEAFWEELTSPPAPGEEALGELRARERGKELYDLLIAPIEGYIRGVSHLVIVPSGELFRVPFSALLRCPGCGKKRDLWRGEYLIERYSISYLPCVPTSLEGGRRTVYRRFLAVSSPYDPLLKTIPSFFTEASIVPPQRFEEELGKGGYDVIYIPCGYLSLIPGAPWISGFHLDSKVPYVSIAGMAELGVGADLLFFAGGLFGGPLSALGSTTEALLGTGIRTFIFSLWSPPWEPTPTRAFFSYLLQGLPKAEALRDAQLKLLRSISYRHPFFWAGYVLYGDGLGGVQVETGKLEYELYRMLIDWEMNPVGTPPSVEVLLTLERSATQGDLESLKALSRELEVLGAYGSFVVVRVPLPLLRELAKLPQVRSVGSMPGMIP